MILKDKLEKEKLNIILCLVYILLIVVFIDLLVLLVFKLAW